MWDEPTLVSFLIVFLLYCTYQPLRFSIEDRERQARYASVFAIIAGAFVPLNFLAVRLAQPLHPPAHARTTTADLPGEMLPPFHIALVGMALLFVTLWKYEMAYKNAACPAARAAAQLGDDDAVPRPHRRPQLEAVIALPASTRCPQPVRRRRLPRLPRADAHLRRDHGRPLSTLERELAELNELADRRAPRESAPRDRGATPHDASCSPSASRTRPRRSRCASASR